MPVYQTEKFLTDLQHQSENFLNKAISEWQMLPTDKFTYKSSPEKWSANQCLKHLNSYGDYYLPAIETVIETALKKSQNSKAYFKPGRLGNYFTKMMRPIGEANKIKKMRSPKEHDPVSNDHCAGTIAKFIDQQEKLLILLEKARSINIEQAKVPISIAKFIKLQLGDVFDFVVAHNHRHILQAEKALKNFE